MILAAAMLYQPEPRPACMPQDLDGANLVTVTERSPEAIGVGRHSKPQDSGSRRLQARGSQVLRHAGGLPRHAPWRAVEEAAPFLCPIPPRAQVKGKEPVKPGTELDFWIGTWKVYSGGRLDGVDVVEKEVAGFAVIENWKDSSGSTGKSLFYYMPAKKQWKQVWVTEAGIYKEKLSEPSPNGIRFSGHVFLPDGREIQDRTTLTRMPNGDVRQVIEFTKDGKKWQTYYDAIYKRSE